MLKLASIFIVAFIVSYLGLGWWSHLPRFVASGLVSGKLTQCPGSPNCVCSDTDSNAGQHGISPLVLNGKAAAEVWPLVRQIVSNQGGRVYIDTGSYLHAIFISSVFRFADDFELRADGNSIQVRSASRVGYSDLGVNRKRVERIRAEILTQVGG